MAKHCHSQKKKKKNRVVANEAFLRFLHNSNTKQRKQLCKIANKDQILSVCECAFNILQKNIPLSDKQKLQLRRHKSAVYKLADKSVSLSDKKKTLEQSGGFLPALLTPIFGTILAEVVSNIVKK